METDTNIYKMMDNGYRKLKREEIEIDSLRNIGGDVYYNKGLKTYKIVFKKP